MSTTYRDDLLAVSAVILGDGTTDRDINHAIDLADRLIRQVDKFVAGRQPAPAPPVVFDGQDDAE